MSNSAQNSGLTVEEVRLLKEKAEQRIMDALVDLQTKTRVDVTRVEVSIEETILSNHIVNCKIDLRI